MQQSEFVLEESVGFLLTQAARAIARDLQAHLNPFGVTPPQLCVLTCLWEEDGLSATALCERAHFDAPTITGILDRLERQELVVRSRGVYDRRVVTAHLTELGSSLRGKLPAIAAATNARAAAGLEPAEVEALRAMLRRVAASLSGPE